MRLAGGAFALGAFALGAFALGGFALGAFVVHLLSETPKSMHFCGGFARRCFCPHHCLVA